MFNHHPDVLHYMWRAFTELGHDVYLATERLTYNFGFRYSSTKEDNKFEVVNKLFKPDELYHDMKSIRFLDITDDALIDFMDIYWSMLPEITQLTKYGKNTWFDGQMQVYLRDKRFGELPGIKSANHPNAWELNKFHFVPNWVDKQPSLLQKKHITQLITECDKVNFTKELKELKASNTEWAKIIKIYGGDKCPDGFIRDINILPYTAMLVHDKQFGINCYAVCKALDMGIPVYMSRQTRELIGFGDLPDSCFLFSDEHSIEDAYELALTSVKNEDIQSTYRKIYTLDRVKTAVKDILT